MAANNSATQRPDKQKIVFPPQSNSDELDALNAKRRSIKPIFVLMDDYTTETKESGNSQSHAHAALAYCACCRNVFPVDIDLVNIRPTWDRTGITFRDEREDDYTMEADPNYADNWSIDRLRCPDSNCESNAVIKQIINDGSIETKHSCGSSIQDVVVVPVTKSDEAPHRSWKLPRYESIQSRVVQNEKDGKISSIATQVYYDDVTVYPNRKKYIVKSAVSEILRFGEHSPIVTEQTFVKNEATGKFESSLTTDPTQAYDCYLTKHDAKSKQDVHGLTLRPPLEAANNTELCSKFNIRNHSYRGAEHHDRTRLISSIQDGHATVRSFDSDYHSRERLNADTEYARKLKMAKADAVSQYVKQYLTDIGTINSDNIDVYADLKSNNLYLSEHKMNEYGNVDYNDPAVNVSMSKMALYETLITKYPAAFEFACKQSDNEIMNAVCSSYRREINDKFAAVPAEEKEARLKNYPASGKARIFRKHVETMESLLTNCDDNILAEIRTAENADDMLRRLKFFAFGPANEKSPAPLKDTKIPTTMINRLAAVEGRNAGLALEAELKNQPGCDVGLPEIKERIKERKKSAQKAAEETMKNNIAVSDRIASGDKTAHYDESSTITSMTDSVKYYKGLKNEFENNPVGVANALYTVKKIAGSQGVTVEQAKELMDTCRGYAKKTHSNTVTIPPVIDSDAVSFLKTYTKAHGVDGLIELYRDPPRTNIFVDTIRMYSTSKSTMVLLPTDTVADSKEVVQSNFETYMRQNQNPETALQSAYIDFARPIQDRGLLGSKPFTGDNVKKYVDGMAVKMLYNSKMDSLAEFRKDHTVEETVAANGDDAKFCGITDNNLDAKLTSYAAEISNHTAKVFCDTGEPLFTAKSIDEIHNHLVDSGGAKEMISCDRYIDYTDEDRAMLNQAYDNPHGEGKISFRLLETGLDYVRTSGALRNCVARKDMHYFDKARQKQCYIVNMTDEVGEIKACIELKKSSGDYAFDCYQFYGPRNHQVESRYADIANKWIEDKHINIAPAHVRFGADDKVIEEGRGVTYNAGVYDEVTGRIIDNNTDDKIKHRRDTHMKTLYNNILPSPDPELNKNVVEMLAKNSEVGHIDRHNNMIKSLTEEKQTVRQEEEQYPALAF